MKNLTIGRKVLFLVAGIVLSICLILGFINFREASSALIDSMELTLVELAKTASTSIRLKLDIYFAQIETIANRNVLKSGDWEQQRIALLEQVEKSDFKAMAVVDRNGNASYPDGNTAQLGDREYFQKALKGETNISDAITSRVSGEVVFIVATPLRSVNNQIQGVLIGRLPGTFLTDVTDALAYGEKGYAYAVDQRGAMIAHKNRDLIINKVSYIEEAKKDKKYAELAALLTRMTNGETGTSNYFYEGEVRYMGYAPVEGTTWSIAMGSYESEALAPVHSMLVIVIISSLALGVIFILIAVFLSRSIGNQIKKVNTQIQDIADAVLQGRLNERADVDAIAVDFKGSAESINHLIDAFVKPITMTLEYLDSISKGEMPSQITETYHGDFNKIKASLNQLIEVIAGLLGETNMLIQAASDGNLKVRGNTAKFQNAWQDMITGVNSLFDAFVRPINLTAEYVKSISTGEIPPIITDTYKGDFNEIKNNFNQLINIMNGLLGETNMLIQSIKDGKLDVRGNDAKFDNAWKDLLKGINDLVVAFVEPINITSEYIQRISIGDIPSLIKSNFKGDFNVIIDNLNQLINIMNGLLGETTTLIDAAKNGKLKVRGKDKQFQNSWQQLLLGINQLMDAIVDPINEVMDVMGRLARKDMTARVRGNYKGDLNIFKQNVNNAGDNLEDALSQVERAVQQITAAAGEIANGSQSLAAGSSEQASSLEEIASSLEEMNSLTLNNAENAKQGMELSEQSLVHVRTGNSAMDRMNHAMDAISKSARETSNIIKTINDIAFQTNLLALNAAVEAAHAGEAGKGFAVVAEEVKNLALRSAEAAQNTDELIEASLKNSEDGAKIVEEVSASFENIQSSFSKVNNIVKEISISSEEQSEGIRQVNVAVGELNKVTQGNAANAEESASAAEELNSQASELKTMVQEFELSNSSGPMTRRNNDIRQVAPPQKKASLPATPRNNAGSKYGNKDMEIVLPMDDDYDGDGDGDF